MILITSVINLYSVRLPRIRFGRRVGVFLFTKEIISNFDRMYNKNKKGYPHFRIAPFFYIIRFLIIFYTPSKNKCDSF